MYKIKIEVTFYVMVYIKAVFIMTKQQIKYYILLGIILLINLYLYRYNVLVRNGLLFGLIMHIAGITEIKKGHIEERKWLKYIKYPCVLSFLFIVVGVLIQPYSYYYVVIIILSIFGQFIFTQKI